MRTRGPDRLWIKRRREKGAFANICRELATEDLPSFKNFMRMDYVTFQALVDKISHKISKNTTVMRKPISASERVALTLRFLATGESFSSLEFQFRISNRAISNIVFEVCEAIYSEMGDTCLAFPSTVEEWKSLERGFREKWNFPHCVGAVDGKHVVIQACGSGSYYYNYKGTHSIVLMVLAGPNYEVVWCNVGMNGRVSDGGVWNRSRLGQAVENNVRDLNFPSPEPLPHRTIDCPYVIIGDDAFALKPNLMKPYPQQELNVQSRVCNYRFSRARRVVENVFGILANRWQVFGSPICLKPNKVELITVAAVTLHNWLIKGGSRDAYAPHVLADHIDPTGGIVPGSWRDNVTVGCMLPLQKLAHGNKPSSNAKEVREEFKEYFFEEGAVNWQWAKCV